MKTLLFLKEQSPLLIRIIILHSMIFVSVTAPMYTDIVHGDFLFGIPFTIMFGVGGFIYMMWMSHEVNEGNL
tara:strand:- start:1213 stop:1428 length:216 start_codon:yes stop_codon:yes gene_type:complete